MVDACQATGPDETSSPPSETEQSAKKLPSTRTPPPNLTPTSENPVQPPPSEGGRIEIKPVEVRLPEKPIQLEAQIKQPEFKPLEIKPVELHFSKEGIHFDGLPLEIKWPQEPLKLSVDLRSDDKNEPAVRSCECARTPSNPEKDRNAESVEALLQKINAKTVELDQKWKRKEQKLEKKIAIETENRRKELVAQHQSGELPEQAFQQRIQELEASSAERIAETRERIERRKWWSMLCSALLLFVFFAVSGGLGGFAISAVESVKRRREQRNAMAKEKAALEAILHTDTKSDDAQRRLAEDRLWKHEKVVKDFKIFDLPASDWIPATILGIVAALMVPALLYFLPGGKLQAAAAGDLFAIVSLCSICFVAAMLGEPFIEFGLKKFRKMTTETVAVEVSEPIRKGEKKRE